ncbi:MAG: response regulator [Dechloromonas sp.]|nr:response regulator [Dechloromonas sp.]
MTLPAFPPGQAATISQKGLLRQLKRSLGIDSPTALAALLARLPTLAASAPPELQSILGGLGDFLHRVDGSYAQYERDLDLRTRSLELSSAELSSANNQLRDELNSREAALASLRSILHELRPGETAASGDSAVDDITALSRQIGQLVAENEQNHRELANQKFALDQHAIVSITDASGAIIYANDRFCAISGYQRDELIGQNHRLLNSGQHSPEFFRAMWQCITEGRVWQGEMCNRAKQGEAYWVNASIVPLLDAHGLPAQYIGIRTDITDRKRMEETLSEQLALVEALLEAIPLPVYLKDPQGRYQRINRAFELFFQVDRKQIIGQTLFDLLPASDAALHAEKDKLLHSTGGVQSYEAMVHSRDGTSHDTIYRKALLTKRNGQTLGLLGTIIDITERKRDETELRQAKDVAEAASRAKSDFLANMSHEIRTPMNGIIGMTDLALDTALTEEQREYMGLVKSSAESLLTIINDILDFSKIEAGKLLVEHISFDLHRVIADTLKSLALRAHEKNLELISEILPDVPLHVIGDPNRIRQVLINLVGNAIKFTPQGEITLHTRCLSQHNGHAMVHIAVHDTGIGIAPDKQKAVFESFTQEDTSTTRKFGGTGLGLSISRRLVELMGGEMGLESTPGQGSVFHFTLRLMLDQSPPQTIRHALGLRNKHLLIVDDNATNRRVLAGMLHAWDIQTTATASGPEALSIVEQQPQAYDGIILDAHMPEMDGYTLASALRQRWPDGPPMLMLSSGAMRGDAQRCQEVGIAGFFAKPISSEELLVALSRIFDLCRDHQQPLPNQLVTRHALREMQRSLDILLVEDHPTNQRLAISLLEKWGHRPTLAVNGQVGVELFRQQRFDLVLMDMQMPVMGGLEATRLIRAHEAAQQLPTTPIIAMTAAAMNEDRAACLAAGMDDYLAKPIKTRALLEKLLALGGHVGDIEATPSGFDYGLALQGADQETVEIIAGIFLATWEQDIAQLQRSLLEQDAALCERTAHSLRGTLASFEAEPAIRVAADIELRARSGDLSGLTPEIDSLAQEIRRLAPHLQRIAEQFSE